MSLLEKGLLERGVMKMCQTCGKAKFAIDFADENAVCMSCEYAQKVRRFTNPSRMTVPRGQPDGGIQKGMGAVAARSHNRPRPESRPRLLNTQKLGLPPRYV